MTERYLELNSNDNQLAAILHQASGSTGVLVIVGGPQYRVGSHRQFVKLSRYLAEHNIPSLRLDTCGMGDSAGLKTPFYQYTADIEAAIDCFFSQCPQLSKVVLWGLCDAASAILVQLNQPDPRIAAAVLLNPWVRQNQSHAEVLLKHYYLKRLFSTDFWKKLLHGNVPLVKSLAGLFSTWKQSKSHSGQTNSSLQHNATEANFIEHMATGALHFKGECLLISSGNDLTAQEFLTLCQTSEPWKNWYNKIQHFHLAEANHTFSTQAWRQAVEQQTVAFCHNLKQQD